MGCLSGGVAICKQCHAHRILAMLSLAKDNIPRPRKYKA